MRGCHVALLLLLLSVAVSAQQPTSPQKQSLLLLRGAIDRSGVLSTWNPTTDVCTSWQGITCDASGQVTTIDLQGQGLQGQLPLDEGLWKNLNTVQNINLAQNSISGFLPPQMSALNSLEYFSVGSNQLESILPVSWDVLANLKGVDLSGNKLFGNLPEQWSNLTSLQAIDLSDNNFSGEIPASWAQLSSLDAASFAGNTALCADNPNAGTSSVPVFYGPCDASSPQLPGINPTYPPIPTPAPLPSPAVVVPSPAVVVPSPAVVVPSPAAVVPSPAVVVPSPSTPQPIPAPPPPSKPSNSFKMTMEVTGMTEAEFNQELKAYTAALAKAAQIPPGWIDVSATTVSSTSGSRRLLQNPVPTLEITNTIYTNNEDETVQNLQNAVDDGSLAASLEALGLTLVPGSVQFDQGSSTNVGAIVGGVIGGVAAVCLIGLLVWYLMKRRRDAPLKAGKVGKVVQGEKSGTAMYTSNPLAVEEGEPQADVTASKKEEFKMYESGMYDNDSTPRDGGSARGTRPAPKGVNPLSLERTGSDLSDPDSQRYATPSDTTGPLTARSRLDSARSGLQSNPAFATPREVMDSSSDDEGNNPMFMKSARTEASDYGSAQASGLELDSSRRYETATESGRTTARTGTSMQSNAMFNADQDEDGAAAGGAGNNPIFSQKGK